MRSHCRCQWQK